MQGDQFHDPIAGDLVVTRVASHYEVSRVVIKGRPWVTINTIDSLSDALTLACGLVRKPQRVLLSARSSKPEHILVDCANRYWEHR